MEEGRSAFKTLKGKPAGKRSLGRSRCIVLYCIEGMVIAAQCTAKFSRSIVLPRI